MNALLRWIDERTGLMACLNGCFRRPLPGGPGLRYVLPSALGFAFVVEAITGIVMWMYYSPGAQSAWESVYWIQERVTAGWLVRGLHSFTGNLMVVLAILWLLQLLVTRMYRAPREVLFWVALFTFFSLLGLLLTGDLLRWDEEGVTATEVRIRFSLMLPVIGGDAFKAAVGGPAFGSFTATRFMALHAGVLSAVLALLLGITCWLVWRMGLSDRPTAPNGRSYWPGQAAWDSAAWIALMVVSLALVFAPALRGHTGAAPGEYLGAPLGAPATPGSAYEAARPEWAFLALYEFAHMFPGDRAIIPIFIVPSLLAGFALLMPFIGRSRIGHAFNVLATAGLLVAAVVLSMKTLARDRGDTGFQAAVAAGHQNAARVRELVRQAGGVPVTGARTLLADDPQSMGPKLFQQHCASCHSHADPNGKGIVAEKSSAPNLYKFASRQWLAGFLNPKQISGPEYFGNTAFKKGEMAGFVKDTFGDLDADGKTNLEATIAALSAEAKLPGQEAADKQDAEKIAKGREALKGEWGCTDCHKYGDKGRLGDGKPDLTGYGSREWLVGIIGNPAHKRFYGTKNDRMPAYAESADQPEKNLLTKKQVEILADWLRMAE